MLGWLLRHALPSLAVVFTHREIALKEHVKVSK